MRVAVGAVAVSAAQASGITVESTVAHKRNPIRTVVTMLQSITKKIEKEGKDGEDLFDKFMCECRTSSAALNKQIETAQTSGSDNSAAAAAGGAQQAQLIKDIADTKASRAAAKETIAMATGIREKEAKAFAASKADSESNIAAMGKALAAIRAGVGGAFLQTDAAKTLRDLVKDQQDLFSSSDKDEVEAFLQGGQGEQQSGEIIGVLSQLEEEWVKDLASAEAAEKDAIATYESLVAAKNKEFETLQASLEEKMTRLGELGVANAEMANAGGDTADQLADDQKSLADLATSCAARTKEWEAEQRSRSEELLALADTIKMLNDDDALDLFKKTLPGASASFVQVSVSANAVRAKAVAVLRAAQQKHKKSSALAFVALALHGKKAGFEKVVALIDRMAGQLKIEQKMDADKKAYCASEFDKSDDEKKVLTRKVADAETAIMDSKETLATLVEEIKTTQATIQGSDKSVAEATAQRQEENAAFKQMKTETTAAIELIGMAKNRMNKFYNPSLYVAAPKRELSREDRIAVNMGGTAPPTPAPGGIAGTGITAFVQVHEVVEAAKKTQESAGVIAMMDLLSKDLESQMQVAETDEKNAQEDYETAMTDAQAKRLADAKLLGEKMSAKAETDAALEGHVEDKKSSSQELMGNGAYIASLHADCDWLIQNYDQREAARTDEIDAMMKAKDVLNGADYSLLEVKRSHFLAK